MPATRQRQATPSASTSRAPVLSPSHASLNSGAKKRGTAELEETGIQRETKKLRTAGVSSRDRDRRKRKKRKRKLSIVTTGARSLPLSQEAIPSPETSVSRATAVKSPSPSPSTRITPALDSFADAASSPTISAHKGKEKVQEESGRPLSAAADSHASQIARLEEQLRQQKLLLERHQSHLIQVQQSLTCQICLDLLYKPYALAPCGHVVCYGCLVQWFTGDDQARPGHQNVTHIYKKKTCPICRALVSERPAEVWGIKSMVTNIAQSGLIELPTSAPADENTDADRDLWHNIFRPARQRRFTYPFEPLPRVNISHEDNEGDGLENLGMYDAEDGGIYRCIDCMHEIWGRICSNCQRIYPGHPSVDEDDNDDSDSLPYEEDSEDDVQDAFRGMEYTGALLHTMIEFAAGHRRNPRGGEEIAQNEDEGWGGQPLDLQVVQDWAPQDSQDDHGEVVFADFTDDDFEDEGTAADSEDEEEGYEDSFIDDGEHDGQIDAIPEVIELDNSPDVGDTRRTRGQLRDEIVISDDEVEVEDSTPALMRARNAGRSFRMGVQPRGRVVLDDSDED